MKLILLTVLIFSVASCTDNMQQEKITPTRNDKSFTMTVNFLPNDDIKDFCTKLGVSYEANGCTAFNLETKHCNIYVVEPKYVTDVERLRIMGHETLHCIYGKYHQ